MIKVKKTLIIDQDKWQFLEPLLGQYVVDEQAATLFDSNIDFDQIKKLPQGTRIVNILNDGYWGSTYTHTDTDHNGKPEYCVRKVSELKRIAMPEYMQHRNAGKLNWEILKQYIDTL